MSEGSNLNVRSRVEILEISAYLLGELRIIHPVLIWDKDTAILVDAGYPGQLSKIREAMEKAGVPLNKLSKIIITHQDLDHIGSLPDILRESPEAIEVMAHEAEKPYIEGEKKLLKFTPEVMDQIDSWPEEWRKPMKTLLENPPKAPVDKTVSDGEELPLCGGITVIATPGHTPGHISLYHKPSKTLICGDAMTVEGGQLIGPDPRFTLDMDLAVKSLQKLLQYDIETVICYHGGRYLGNANQRIAELASGQWDLRMNH
jgi:glyoxylase-like metal-dependent hydrolase (beta-lactamase superfamily II)